MAHWRRRIFTALSVILCVAVLLMLAGWFSMRQTPTFYAKRLVMERPVARAAGDALERNTLATRNQVRRPGPWQIVVTEEEINGWLAEHLMEKFPQLLPASMSEPRVAFSPERAQAAVRYRDEYVDSVLSVDVDVYLLERPNEVALKLRGMAAGLLPLPPKKLLDEISQAAARANAPVYWSEEAGDPVMVFRVPATDKEFQGRKLRLTTLTLRQGELVVGGVMNDE